MERRIRSWVMGGLGALLTLSCSDDKASLGETHEPPGDTSGVPTTASMTGDTPVVSTSSAQSSDASSAQSSDASSVQSSTASSSTSSTASSAADAGALTATFSDDQTSPDASAAVSPTPSPSDTSVPATPSVPVTTSTPSPGNDALSAIVIPEGCTQTSEFTTGDGLLLFTCDGQPHTVHCSELPNGWRCECHTEFADYTGESKTYELDAPSAARAASVTALTCLGPDPTLTASPTDDTEEDCSSDQQADTSTCSLSEICRRSRTIDDVRVTFQDVGRTYSCTRDGSGFAACRCDDWVWKFADVQLEMGCGFVRTFCESETRTPIGEPDCTSVFEEAAADRCSVSQECKNAMQLSDGSIATVVLAEGASCDAYMTDRPSCSCTDRDGHLQRFEHSSSPLTLDACWEANDVCGQIAQYQPMGSYQCELESRSEAGTRCDRNLNCRQPATVGDTEVDLLGALTVHCDSSADSTWQCACTSNSTDGFVSNEAQVTVDAADASAACEAAETRCSDEVDVVFADGLPGN